MSVSISTNQNIPKIVDINALVNGGLGPWIISTSLTHNNDRGSYVEKLISSLIISNSYRVTYTISSYTSCQVQLFFGDTAGTIQTSAGTFTEVLTLTGSKKIRFHATGTATINYYKIEQLVNTIVDTPVDITTMQNNSWTLSFNPILNQWISFHSYLPNNYLQHPRKLLVKDNLSDIFLNNSGNYGQYLHEDLKPFIIETIFNEYPTETKVFDSIHFNLDTTNDDDVVTNTFFDEGIVYTESQCSGTITFDLTNLTKKEKNWNFNKFNDITNNLSQKVFVSDWDTISIQYPIDKVINVNKLDTSKPWYLRGRMRDKYLAVRFIESNSTNDKLFCKFIATTFRASQR